MVLTIALGIRLYDARGAASWARCCSCSSSVRSVFAGLGFGAAALIRSSDGVSAAVNLVILPMAFLSGAFGPTEDYPAVLRAIGDALPLTYFVDLVEAAYLAARRRGATRWRSVCWRLGRGRLSRRRAALPVEPRER